MKAFMKRVQSICIILILLRAVYEYAELTVTYQHEEVVDQEEKPEGEMDSVQLNRQIIRIAVESAYIMQTMTNPPPKSNVPERNT